jgi:DNA-binding LacI/PurR family transcriptional regulator
MAWLIDLPKPCGVFAVNDARALRNRGTLSPRENPVPEDIALIAWMSTSPSENTSPTITRIRPDYEEADSAPPIS